MNIKDINENFDREYERYSKSPEYKEFVKIKMPKYYIAKHSDEDLQAAVLAEREACARLCDEIVIEKHGMTSRHKTSFECAAAIRARGNT